MFSVKKLKFFMIFVLCLMLSLPVQASNQLTLYSNWRAQITFDANGGVLMGGNTDAERALAGRSSGSISYSANQTVSTGLSGQKDGSIFLEWNTRSDGMGTSILDYGTVRGPVTFYAIYYQTDYYPNENLQTFRAPYSGWYQLECWGGSGSDVINAGESGWGYGGRGGYVSGRLHLNKGDILYVNVGWGGVEYRNNENRPGHWLTISGEGGDAADIRTGTGLESRFLVAGGGGSGAAFGPLSCNGGYAGGLTAGGGSKLIYSTNYDTFAPTGATQTQGGMGSANGRPVYGSFGYGSDEPAGDGWYGGSYSHTTDIWFSGSGGSSYAAGFPGCPASSTGIVLTNPQLLSGQAAMTRPDGGMEMGHVGNAHARLVCVQRD